MAKPYVRVADQLKSELADFDPDEPLADTERTVASTFLNMIAARSDERRRIPEVKISSSREYVPVWFLSDSHAFHEDFDSNLFLQYRDWAVQNKAYVICLGDLIEGSIPTHMPATMWSQTLSPSEQTKWMCKELAPLRGRIITMMDGNHEDRIVKTTSFSPTEIMCDKLKCLYMKDGGYLRLNVGGVEYTLALFHGASFSNNPRLEPAKAFLSYPDADLIAIGHTHKIFQEQFDFFRANGDLTEMGYVLVIRTGGFLGYPSYVKKKMGVPTMNGSPICYFGTRTKVITANTTGRLM